MTPPDDLPAELLGQPFTVSDARRSGVRRRRLGHPDLLRPFHGVRVPVNSLSPDWPDDSPTGIASTLRRVRAYAPLLRPGQYFSHLTAARLWHAPLPLPSSDTEPLHVTAQSPKNGPRTAGVVGHSAKSGQQGSARYGLPVSNPADTWVSLAPLLSLDDLVAVGDALILVPAIPRRTDERPFTKIPQLADAIEHSSGRDSKKAREALRHIRQGSESRPESLLRLLLVRAGFPAPILNANVSDRAGNWLGRADMLFPQWNVVVEYDGDQHRTNSYQYEKDITRIENFERSGWAVVRVRKQGLFIDRAGTVARVNRALRSHGWVPQRTVDR